MKLPSLTADSASEFSRLPNKFARLPNKFSRSSNLIPTVPVGGDIKGTVLISVNASATPALTVTRSATVAVEITTTASGQQTDQQYDRSASISVTIEATADGGLPTQTHSSSTADCQVNISASANGYNTSDTIPDETTNGNNIVMSGTGWTFNTDAAIGTHSVNFSGGQDFGIIDEPYLSLLRSPWSFSCWYKPSEGNMGGNYPAHLITTDYGGSDSYFKMYHYNQKLRWFTRIDSTSGTTLRDTSSNVFSSGTGNGWSHIVVTLDNLGDPTIYINGSAVTLTTDSTPNTLNISNYSSTGDIRIGSFSSYSYKIDDVAFWSTELTSTQVSNLYNSGSGTDLTGSSNLAGWWKMGDSNVTTQTHSGTASCQVNLSASASANVVNYLYESDVLSISNNLLWLRADDIDGDDDKTDNPSDNTSISSWVSRNDGLTVSCTSGLEPTFQTNENGTLPAVKFDSTDELYVDWDSSMTNFTVFLVVKNYDSAAPGGYIMDGGQASASRLGWLDRSTGNFRMGGVANFSEVLSESGQSADTDWHIITAHYNGANSSLRVDLSAADSGDIGASNGTYAASEGIVIGGANHSNLYGSKILVAEVLAYSGGLSTSDRDKVEGYLNDKWSITTIHSGTASCQVNLSASASGSVVAGAFTISTFDTETNILSSTPSDGTIAYGTDTESYYVYDSSLGWAEFIPS